LGGPGRPSLTGQLETFDRDAKTSRKQSPAGRRTMAGLAFVDEAIR
jgi:hypothetical protein